MTSKFISETEIEEKKKLRQEEWERVRNPEDPVEAPEAPIDNRSLFARLQEQKLKKQEEFEESKKLKNLVKCLEEDEVKFLDEVDELRLLEERRKRLEEAQELNEFREQASKLREEEVDNYIKAQLGLNSKSKSPGVINKLNSPSIGIAKNSQTKLLANIVRKKNPSTSDSSEPEPKKLKQDSSPTKDQEAKNTTPITTTPSPNKGQNSSSQSPESLDTAPYKSNLVCIGVLPGLTSYSDSEEEEDLCCDKDSSDSDDDEGESCSSASRDLCGRKIVYEDKNKDK